ncbi:AAA family ATPase [Simiduia agarivorans]|uniref:ATPase n=1 Tax=Simiduia agarivorans (strain DSM 21679 / JCM 13881 / BCRC 17597 / SA1) TaxID=1117647 RepID=K4KGV1_SIMAS|nr:MoxR family ATPase [Simiduia agarivorans]AFU97440.1 ATPase [Simiduia agarivorans SA1 = DSM 21679]
MTTQAHVLNLRNWLNDQIVGQEALVDRLFIALLADGHLLVEGAPGLAKTKAIKLLSDGIEGSFHRIQFTPDLLPSDVTGTDIYRAQTGTFEFQQGPIFHNLVLADEINRAPAKVQSALLEAMAERQITVGRQTYPLPGLFLVMATQNPIEQEGTYPLPEAQLDRFLMHVKVAYPSPEAERQILRLVRNENLAQIAQPPVKISETSLLQARRELMEIHMAEAIEDYIVHLIDATRQPAKYDSQLAQWLEYGASPRGTLALERVARARAWMQGRDFVTPDDVQALATDVLRHRIILTFEAEAEGINADQVIEKLLGVVTAA